MAVLTACSSPATNAAGCDAPVKEGDASKLVKVTGEFGAAPTVEFPTPLKPKPTQRSEVIAGEGEGVVLGNTDLIVATLRAEGVIR